MRFEVSGFGVKVVLIEPGLITTNFENAAVASMDSSDEGPYGVFNAQVARVIEKSLNAKRPKIRYTVTPSASLSIASRKLLGARGWDAAMSQQFPRPGK